MYITMTSRYKWSFSLYQTDMNYMIGKVIY